jgi:DNA-binding NtrC family response regulator
MSIDPNLAPLIFLAEDDTDLRILVARRLRRMGCDVLELRNGMELLEQIEGASELDPPDLVISDHRMPGTTGIEALEALRARDALTPFVLITAFGDRETHAEARHRGAQAIFDKPFELDDLCATVRGLLAR